MSEYYYGTGLVDAEAAVLAAAAAGGPTPSVKYTTHIQNVGWQTYKYDGETSGTIGHAWRLESIGIEIDGMDNAIEYSTHIETLGWRPWASDGEYSGTCGLRGCG